MLRSSAKNHKDVVVIVDPADYPRFAALDVTPVLSFQWGKPAADTVGALKDYLGPQRYATVQPQALLLNAGARVAYGSDWPVDPLDEWFALKVGVTRTAAPNAGQAYAGKLTAQPGMPRADVLRAWISDGAVIYVCGSLQGMAGGVDDALAAILGRAQLEQLAEEGRYCRDVY